MKTHSVNTVRRQQSAGTFTQEQWYSIATQISAAFRMNEVESDKFRNRKIAQLIAAIPFLSGSKNPERTALSHLATYLLAATTARTIFDHAFHDDHDIMARLETISHFEDGDRSIIDRGMRLLALNMVCGYVRDLAKDEASGEYNPVLSGAWDADVLIEHLKKEIEAVPCERMDNVITIPETIFGFWAD